MCVCYLAHYIIRLSEEFEGRSKSRGVLVSCECLSVHLCALGLEFDQLKIKYLLLLEFITSSLPGINTRVPDEELIIIKH